MGKKNTRGIKKPKGYLFVPFQLLLFIYLSSYESTAQHKITMVSLNEFKMLNLCVSLSNNFFFISVNLKDEQKKSQAFQA